MNYIGVNIFDFTTSTNLVAFLRYLYVVQSVAAPASFFLGGGEGGSKKMFKGAEM